MTTPSCLNCAYVSWERTKSGALHPNSNGRCEYIVLIESLPKAFYWIAGPPHPAGGCVDRRKPHENCPQWRAAETVK